MWRPQESVTLKELIKPVGTVNCVCNFRILLFLLHHCNQTEAPYTQDVAMGWRGLRVVTCKRSWGHSLCLHSYDIYIHNTLDFSRRARKMWLEGCKNSLTHHNFGEPWSQNGQNDPMGLLTMVPTVSVRWCINNFQEMDCTQDVGHHQFEMPF